MTISISVSQIFRSWVAIYQLDRLWCLYLKAFTICRDCSSYECLNILRATRLLNKLSNRDTSRNAWNRHWRCFMTDTGILSKNTKIFSRECYITFCSIAKYNDNSPPIRLYTNPWPFYRTRPFTDLWGVSIEHLRRL